MSDTIYMLYYGTFISIVTIVIYELFSLILRIFGIKRFEYCGSAGQILLNNLSNGFSTSMHVDYPSGIVCVKWYVGYISYSLSLTDSSKKNSQITLLCKQNYWDNLIIDHSIKDTIIVYKHYELISVNPRKYLCGKIRKKLLIKY